MFDFKLVQLNLTTFDHVKYVDSVFADTCHKIFVAKNYLAKFGQPFDDRFHTQLELQLMESFRKLSDDVSESDLMRDHMLIDFGLDLNCNMQFIIDCLYTKRFGSRALPYLTIGRAFMSQTSASIIEGTDLQSLFRYIEDHSN